MKAFIKAIIVLARYHRRTAVALERIASLYELELRSNGIVPVDSTLKDPTEVSYGSMKVDETNLEGW